MSRILSSPSYENESKKPINQSASSHGSSPLLQYVTAHESPFFTAKIETLPSIASTALYIFMFTVSISISLSQAPCLHVHNTRPCLGGAQALSSPIFVNRVTQPRLTLRSLAPTIYTGTQRRSHHDHLRMPRQRTDSNQPACIT